MNLTITTNHLPETHINPDNGLTYELHGDYYLPLLSVENAPSIGYWGRLRQKYLQENKPLLFNQLVITGKLFEHLAETDRAACERMETIIRQMKQAEGITEALKACDQMAWVRAMNSIATRAREIVQSEIIDNE